MSKMDSYELLLSLLGEMYNTVNLGFPARTFLSDPHDCNSAFVVRTLTHHVYPTLMYCYDSKDRLSSSRSEGALEI